MTQFNAVPAQYVGLWQRLSREDANGEIDDTKTTQIFWLQSHSLHIDIRMPLARPSFGNKSSLSEYHVEELRFLAQQEGFAGVTEVNGELCTWHRRIDYQPPRKKPDIGRMDFKKTTLHEYGIHNDYKELWKRHKTTTRQLLGLELLPDSEAQEMRYPRRSYFVVVDDYFMFASDRHRTIPHAASLIDLIDEKDYSRDVLIDILDFEISFGVRFSGKVPWEIQLSTLPFREGKSLLTSDQISSLQPPNRVGEEIVIAPLDSRSKQISGQWVVRDLTPGFAWSANH